jgi:hypothetical protein
MPFTFPLGVIFNPREIKASIVYQAVVGPPSISGVVQTLRTDGGGLWRVDMTGIPLRTPKDVRAWEAWQAEFGGGAGTCIVPIPSIGLAHRPLAGGKPIRTGGLYPQSDDACFPEALDYGAPIIVAEVVGDAALRATTITINVIRGGRLTGGEKFGLTHATMGKRMYRIRRVLSRPTDQSATVLIETPLREAVVSGATVNFDLPAVLSRAIPEQDFGVALSRNRGEVSISFLEAF